MCCQPLGRNNKTLACIATLIKFPGQLIVPNEQLSLEGEDSREEGNQEAVGVVDGELSGFQSSLTLYQLTSTRRIHFNRKLTRTRDEMAVICRRKTTPITEH